MKTLFKLIEIKKVLIILIAPLFFIACSGDDVEDVIIPEVEIIAIDCPSESIVVTPIVKVVSGGSGRWSVKVTVNITCMGEPVNNAEIKVKYSWLGTIFKSKTGPDGNAKHSRIVHSTAMPSGSVDVTVQGFDDSVTQNVTF